MQIRGKLSVADGSVLDAQRLGQRVFTRLRLIAVVIEDARSNGDHGHNDSAVAEHLRLVRGSPIENIEDFLGELVAFQFFAGLTIHGKLLGKLRY